MMWAQGLPLAYFQKLVSSMPRLIKAVMAAKVQKCEKMLCKERFSLTLLIAMTFSGLNSNKKFFPGNPIEN
jgi:hypothetical protein